MSKELKIRIVIMLVILFAFVVFMTWNEKYISKSNYSKENIDEIKISFEVIEENGEEISYITYAGTITDEKLIQDIVEDLNKVYFIKEPKVIQDLITTAKIKSSQDGYNWNNPFTRNVMLFRTMADTLKIKIPGNETTTTSYPMRYDFDDFSGEKEWSKMFVSKLLDNCNSFSARKSLWLFSIPVMCFLMVVFSLSKDAFASKSIFVFKKAFALAAIEFCSRIKLLFIVSSSISTSQISSTASSIIFK